MKFEIKFCDGTVAVERTLVSAIHAVAYAYQSTIAHIHDLPPTESPVVWGLTTRTGHHSGRATIGGLGLWNVPARNLIQHLQ